MSTARPIATTRVVDDADNPRLLRRKIRLEVLRGPDTGKSVEASSEEISIGTLPTNEFVLADPSVSRYHLRVTASVRGFVITDLDSTNGTWISGLRVREVTAAGAVEARLGDTAIRISPLPDEVEVPLSQGDRLGSMLGRSPQMRALFAQIEAVGRADATVLIEGETGTGKELLAEEIHRASARKDKPFIIVDCGALPDNLIESELFGHTRGAFTGASGERAGAFEVAHGGTLFLDEIGEMTPAAQPRLLRVLERRQVKRVGSDRYREVDVRIVAATNRDLRLAVNEGTFRPDLFYRLSVLRLRLPPLRERPEDVELLARHFLEHFAQRLAPGKPTPPIGPETLQRLVGYRWAGNVRELRNFMQRVALMAHGAGLGPAASLPIEGDLPQTSKLNASPPPLPPDAARPRDAPGGASVAVDLPYKEAKAQWIDSFETTYVKTLLNRCDQNVAAAAREAGVDRTYLFRLIRKYNLRDG
ncbi:MAG: hypothetical protein CSA65_07275 [Proteobacteria bacterium]|nr:MAG: hypothetical protein CSB49_02205 [Pseudomonadota bacterium]PIE17816.1 MAG: hypothetical protein CSA65_07275 [Pseudomonadota bacterium]